MRAAICVSCSVRAARTKSRAKEKQLATERKAKAKAAGDSAEGEESKGDGKEAGDMGDIEIEVSKVRICLAASELDHTR